MKKKILLTAYSLDYGGIEKALLNLLKMLDKDKYEITLLLEKKEGVWLTEIPEEVNLEIYSIHEDKNILLRKIKNRIKLWKWIKINKEKYDFAGCFATYSIPSSILVRYASSNNCMFIHSNYRYVYNENYTAMKHFFNERSIHKFKKLIFVSEQSRCDFIKVYQDLISKTQTINNLIDEKNILSLSKENIKEEKKEEPLLLFVGRLEEKAKRVTRLLDIMAELKEEEYPLSLWIIGDGPDKKMYEELIDKLNLNDRVQLLGGRSNPYPYMELADLIVLPSDYEGFPVTCLEAMVLNKPFLTTIYLSDNYIKLEDYGYITDKNIITIKEEIKKILKKKKKTKKTFSSEKYNKTIINDLEKLINGE